ncbi:MAG: hypothetical protein MI742_09250 [Desulfobacterales bacterium]|nr:hypothetical protein [Desulfobacterales bacterium]
MTAVIAADPQEIEEGEEAMVSRVVDGLNPEPVISFLKNVFNVDAVEVEGVHLAAYKGEPVFRLDLALSISKRGEITVPLPHICRDKDELARRSRLFWRNLVRRQQS